MLIKRHLHFIRPFYCKTADLLTRHSIMWLSVFVYSILTTIMFCKDALNIEYVSISAYWWSLCMKPFPLVMQETGLHFQNLLCFSTWHHYIYVSYWINFYLFQLWNLMKETRKCLFAVDCMHEIRKQIPKCSSHSKFHSLLEINLWCKQAVTICLQKMERHTWILFSSICHK